MARRSASSLDSFVGAGDPPDGWRVVELGEVAELQRNGVNPQAAESDRYVGLEHIDSSALRITRWGSPADVRSGKFRFRPGDILYAKLRPYLNKGALAEWEGICSTDILVIRPGEQLDSGFLALAVHHPAFLAHAIATTSGVNHPRTSWDSLKKVRLALPPLDEQRTIASSLWAVNAVRERTEKVISSTRELKRSVMSHLFTLGPANRETAEVQATDFGPIPAHWNLQRLDQCAFIQSGVTKGRRLAGHTIDVPYLRVANVQDGFLDLRVIKTIQIKATELERFMLRPGDVLFTEGGDLDKLGRGHVWRGEIEPCVHQNHVFAVRPNPELLSPDYLAFLVQSEFGKRYFLRVGHRTTNLASINKSKLGALPVPIPPHDEQNEIVRILSALDRKLDAETGRRDAIVRLVDTLLVELMTGRRRVPHVRVA